MVLGRRPAALSVVIETFRVVVVVFVARVIGRRIVMSRHYRIVTIELQGFYLIASGVLSYRRSVLELCSRNRELKRQPLRVLAQWDVKD